MLRSLRQPEKPRGNETGKHVCDWGHDDANYYGEDDEAEHFVGLESNNAVEIQKSLALVWRGTGVLNSSCIPRRFTKGCA
jgi:hypothetical protein